MAELRLDAPSAFRIVAAAAATVASLGLVALGVQIGTNGLGSGGPERNPASAAASPAAAVVNLGRTRPVPSLGETILALLPTPAVVLPVVTAPGVASTTSALDDPSLDRPAAVPSPADAPSPAPAPAPAPPGPVPTPTPPVLPAPTDPPPVPGTEPIIDPVAPLLDPLLDVLLDPGSSDGTPLVPTLAGIAGA